MTSPPMSEAAFQQRIVDYCDHSNLLVFHDTDPRRNRAGFPDLVIVGATDVLYRELKTDTGKLRPEQTEWLRALRNAGANARLWRPRDWDAHVLPELRALGRLPVPSFVRRTR